MLSRKPMLYVLNLGDEEAARHRSRNRKAPAGKAGVEAEDAVVPFCGKIEAELSELPDAEMAEMMSAYGLKESGRDRLIQASYRFSG